MEKRKIGIDLDDVVFEFVKDLLKEYENEFGKKILFEDVFSYNFPDLWHLNEKETLDFFGKILTKEFNENLSLCTSVKEIIFNLSKTHQIYFITARTFQEGTLESLKKHFSEIPFELIFSSNFYANTKGKSKGEICNELGIDFMVEDDRRNSENCANKGIKTILLDKPWNQNCEHENIIRVKDWKEILEKLNGN